MYETIIKHFYCVPKKKIKVMRDNFQNSYSKKLINLQLEFIDQLIDNFNSENLAIYQKNIDLKLHCKDIINDTIKPSTIRSMPT